MQLNKISTIDAGDWIVLWKTGQGEFMGMSFTDFVAALAASAVAGRPEALTQYAAPSATAFSVQINDADDDVHLILTPTAGFADGEIVLPAPAHCRDKQEIVVNCTQAVAALVVDGNGALAVTGAPTALAANEFFRLAYDLATQSWYRIG